MEPETWVGLTTSGGNPICILFVTGISESTLGEGKALFGDSFLRNYYVVHDVEENQVGFAGAKDLGLTLAEILLIVFMVLCCCCCICACLISICMCVYCKMKSPSYKTSPRYNRGHHNRGGYQAREN